MNLMLTLGSHFIISLQEGCVRRSVRLRCMSVGGYGSTNARRLKSDAFCLFKLNKWILLLSHSVSTLYFPSFNKGCHLTVLAGDHKMLEATSEEQRTNLSKSNSAAFTEWQQGWTAEWHHCFSTTQEGGGNRATHNTVPYILWSGWRGLQRRNNLSITLWCTAIQG